MDIKIYDLFNEYDNALAGEAKISRVSFNMPTCTAQEVLGIVQQLECVAKSNTVLRCCSTRYGSFDPNQIGPETVAAHTNLMQVIVDRVLMYYYGPSFTATQDGDFTYREIMEVIRRHDLPENIIGDIADNGNRDDVSLRHIEQSYLYDFAKASPRSNVNSEEKISLLQYNMDTQLGFTGQLLYAADKMSAIFATLEYDCNGASPTMSTAFKGASRKEAKAMELCEFYSTSGQNKICRASEMWTIDYFKFRKLYQYDSTGLITAILIMKSIITNGKWYSWRKADYAKVQ